MEYRDKRIEGKNERKENLIKVGSGILNSAINALPFELHIPGYQFCGPGTRLDARLARGERGINPLDAACREHDIRYSQHKDLEKRHEADKILAKCAKKRIIAKDATIGERAAATATWIAMNVKRKIGMGVQKKNNKRYKRGRKLKAAKRGGFLPLLPILGALGSLVGGASAVANAVNKAKSSQKQLEEIQRHNRAMEGHGLYLKPQTRYGHGIQGGKEQKKKKRRRNRKRKN